MKVLWGLYLRSWLFIVSAVSAVYWVKCLICSRSLLTSFLVIQNGCKDVADKQTKPFRILPQKHNFSWVTTGETGSFTFNLVWISWLPLPTVSLIQNRKVVGVYVGKSPPLKPLWVLQCYRGIFYPFTQIIWYPAEGILLAQESMGVGLNTSFNSNCTLLLFSVEKKKAVDVYLHTLISAYIYWCIAYKCIDNRTIRRYLNIAWLWSIEIKSKTCGCKST